MRRAIAISAEAHGAAMRGARAGSAEYEIEAAIEYVFRAGGASGPAYPSIVAWGANATILHYMSNDRVLAGGGPAADRRRRRVRRLLRRRDPHLPGRPRFEGRGRALYARCWRRSSRRSSACGLACASTTCTSAPSPCSSRAWSSWACWRDRQRDPREGALQALLHAPHQPLAGDGRSRRRRLQQGGASRVLEAGMVLTVEPGLYVGEHVEDIDAAWHGSACASRTTCWSPPTATRCCPPRSPRRRPTWRRCGARGEVAGYPRSDQSPPGGIADQSGARAISSR